MASSTQYYKLTIPQSTDTVSIATLGGNFTAIDNALHNLQEEMNDLVGNQIPQDTIEAALDEFLGDNPEEVYVSREYFDSKFPIGCNDTIGTLKRATMIPGGSDKLTFSERDGHYYVRIKGTILIESKKYDVDKEIEYFNAWTYRAKKNVYITFDTDPNITNASDRIKTCDPSVVGQMHTVLGYLRYRSDAVYELVIFGAKEPVVTSGWFNPGSKFFIDANDNYGPPVMDWTTHTLSSPNNGTLSASCMIGDDSSHWRGTVNIPTSGRGYIVWDRSRYGVNDSITLKSVKYNESIPDYYYVIGTFDSDCDRMNIPCMPSLVQITGSYRTWHTYNLFNNPKIACFGDDIVAGTDASNLSFTCYGTGLGRVYLANYGIAGTGYAFTNESTSNCLVGDGTYNKATSKTCPTINKISDYIQEVMSGANAPVTDYILVEGGTNDFIKNISKEDFETGVRAAVNMIYSLGKTPILMTPPPQLVSTRDDGVTKDEFVQIIIDVCKEMNCTCIDIYHNCGLNATNEINRKKCFGNNGESLYLSSFGHLNVANAVIGGLRSIAIC